MSRSSALRRVARFLLPYRARVAVALAALVVAAACWLALGQGVKHVIDGGFAGGEPRALDRALAGVLGIAAVLALATWLRFYLMMSLGERVVTDLRRAVFGHILGLEPAFFEATRTGEVISRLTNDATLLQQVIGYGLSMFLRNALMMAGAAAMLFVTSWKLAALVLVGVPATLLPILLLGRRVRRLSRASQDRVADVSAYVDEAVHEIRTVQAYAHEDADRAGFGRHAEAAYRAGVARVRQKAWLIPSVMLIAFSAVGVIMWIGGHDVFAGPHQRGRALRVRVLRRDARGGRRHGGRGVGRAAARRGRRRAADRSPRHRAAGRRSRDARRRAGPRRGAHVEFDDVDFAYPSRPGAPALTVHAERHGGRARRAGRPVRRRQIDAVRAAASLLRSAARGGAHRWHRPARHGPARLRAAWSRWCRRIP